MQKFFTSFHQTQKDHFIYWCEKTLWHSKFWILLILAILPWLFWFLFRKRGSEARLLLSGGFVAIISSWFDFLGISLGIWSYNAMLLPTIPSFLPWDFSLLPVITMFWLQYKPSLNLYFKAIVYSGLTAFLGEPLSEWIGLYNPNTWSPFYSFPIYFLIYLVAYRISKTIKFNYL
ncbi:CBO0543 family protein [Robertmurraya sp. GLU-23]